VWFKKKRFIIPIALIALFVVAGVAGGGSNTKTDSANAGTNAANVTDNAATAKKNDSKVTLDEYNKVQNGMTYQQVKDIFGGAENSASSSSIGDQTVDTLTWNGDGFGDTVMIQFDGAKESGKVMTKSQYGLGNG
jgi:hypothetical protein